MRATRCLLCLLCLTLVLVVLLVVGRVLEFLGLPSTQQAVPELPARPGEEGGDWAGPPPGFLVFQSTGPQASWPALQSGVVTAYVLAQMTGRRFAMRVTYPCRNFTRLLGNDLSDLEQTAGDRFHRSSSKREVVLGSGQETDVDRKPAFLSQDADFPEEFVLVTASHDLLEALRSSRLAGQSALLRQGTPRADLYRSVLDSLFRPPAPVLPNDVSLKEIDACAHVVMGPATQLSCLNDRVLHDLLSLLTKHARKGRVYLSTDSRQLALKAEKLLSPKALVLHRAWPATSTEGGACRAFQEELLDQETLRRCRTLAVNHVSGLLPAYWHLFPRDLELYCLTATHLVPCDVDSAWDVMQSAPYRCPPEPQ